ncbi:AraC family transcriptional regulator [Hymenobacter arizonensis]|uniref:Cupin domain-containing protein n=1 Tax=Hymenobacter arizonensis TaxID=1227077 RepID=A0A1I6BP08_HYMAR|nr:AraC family transcriptional regulator [Hymenobacter arizonensis]SFQ82656.1 Cupin domain-containing protein [Hymenobacter arizonensis]
MKRRHFLATSLWAAPGAALGAPLAAFAPAPDPSDAPPTGPSFTVDAGAGRFGKKTFVGPNPNDLKIAGQDTGGALAVFEYTGTAKGGPSLHLHEAQDEVFYVVAGAYRFVVGAEQRHLRPGDTIFLPHQVSHTWTQLTDTGKLLYFLQPAGKMDFLCLPQGELTNTFIDAEAVWGAELRQLTARLGSAAGWPEMLPLLERFLLGRIARRRAAPHPADAVGQLLLRPGPRLGLDALADYACLSPRQLDRQCVQRLGVGPALYARIARFDRAFRLKNRQPELDWLSVAVACGYHDHQHLAKDYRAFTGRSPGAFYRQDTQAPERGFGLVEAGGNAKLLPTQNV